MRLEIQKVLNSQARLIGVLFVVRRPEAARLNLKMAQGFDSVIRPGVRSHRARRRALRVARDVLAHCSQGESEQVSRAGADVTLETLPRSCSFRRCKALPRMMLLYAHVSPERIALRDDEKCQESGREFAD